MKATLATLALLLSVPVLRGEPVSDLIKKGDLFDQKLQPDEALKFYLPAEKLVPQDVHLQKRIARQYRHLMVGASSNEEKVRLGRVSLEYARRAAALGPNDAEAQLSEAISLGKLLPLLGSKEQVDASPRIKRSVDKALALDPRNDLAWHVLGRWNRVLADIGGVKRAMAGAIYGKLPVGSNEEAERCLQKALALNPASLRHYIELGRIYVQMGRKEDARRFLIKGLAMPEVEMDDPEMKAFGREALAKVR